ncbi:MAG: precorrin-6Y C5,15-methyltransferase (decarboxylating) subunit CbiT [Candidatus Caldatribacteriaceae bacterium]
MKGNFPMTKEEIRAVIISKLRLASHHVVWDVGAGTGSVTVEIARVCREGKVFAVERNEDACKLIVQNAKRFKIQNIEIVQGEAPSVLRCLPFPDRVFVGGSGGKTKAIFTLIRDHIKEKGIIVISSITIETISIASRLFERWGFETELVLLNFAIGKKRKGKHLFIARNPIYLCSAWR